MGLLLLAGASFVSGIKLTALYEHIFAGVKFSLNDYHLHHSLYGVALVGAATVLHLSQAAAALTLAMIAFGLGSIAQHTRSERFVFIERENRALNLLQGWEKTRETTWGREFRITFYRNSRLPAARAGALRSEDLPDAVKTAGGAFSPAGAPAPEPAARPGSSWRG